MIVNRNRLDDRAEFITAQYTTDDEVYGWFAHNGRALEKNSGWYRTSDPQEALRLATLIALRDGIIDHPAIAGLLP